MVFARVVVLMSLLLLAACGGDDSQGGSAGDPAETDEASSGQAESQDDEDETLTLDELEARVRATPVPYVSPTPRFEGGLPVAPPGTLVASETESPLAGEVFDTVTFRQEGGPNNAELTIEISSDGRVVRNDVTTTIPESEVAALNERLAEIKFFGMQGTFLGAVPKEQDYRYQMRVVMGGQQRTINAQASYMPNELKSLFAYVRGLGEGDATAGG